MILTGFTALDSLTGGLEGGKNYLIYGDVGAGKSTFGLQFLYQGLVNGESVALITRRSARDIFDQGLAFSMDLEPFARSENLIILEYLPRVIENAMRLKDHDDIAHEIEDMLGEADVSRIVFDPITPLLASPSSSLSVFRARSLIQGFSSLEATCLYLFDTPDGQEYLGSVKDFVYGTLRLEAGETEGTGSMIIERIPGLKGRSVTLTYEITHGQGMVELAGLSAEGKPVQRKILIIEPSRPEVENLRALLGKEHNLLVTDNGADGMAKLAVENPDLLILEREAGGMDGVDICRKLRANRMNVPIILIAQNTQRSRDKVEIMSAGADEILARPIDGRMLKLKVQSLLRRYDGARDRFATAAIDSSITAAPDRDASTKTSNLVYFFERIRQEIVYSTDHGLSLAVIVMHIPPESADWQELRDAAGSVMREYDLLYNDKDRVAILLAESDEKGVNAYLRRFEEKWKRTPAPKTSYRCFNRQPDFLQSARALMDQATGTRATSGSHSGSHA